MIKIEEFISGFSTHFTETEDLLPWQVTQSVSDIIERKIAELDSHFIVRNGMAIHETARIEERAILKAPVIIGEGCFVGAHAYLRNGVYLGKGSSVGPACEIKSSIIFNDTEIAHLNFIGDSVIGSDINFEAGSITANYFNERRDKLISVLYGSKIIETGVKKFGSLVGDGCKIGANAVLSPGTILTPGIVIKRLELVEQLKL